MNVFFFSTFNECSQEISYKFGVIFIYSCSINKRYANTVIPFRYIYIYQYNNIYTWHLNWIDSFALIIFDEFNLLNLHAEFEEWEIRMNRWGLSSFWFNVTLSKYMSLFTMSQSPLDISGVPPVDTVEESEEEPEDELGVTQPEKKSKMPRPKATPSKKKVFYALLCSN